MTSFTVSMILRAQDYLSRAVDDTARRLRGLGDAAAAASRAVPRDPFMHWGERLDQVQKTITGLQERARRMETGGLGQIAAGVAMAMPFQQTVKAAGDFQDVLKAIELATYDTGIPLAQREEQLKKLGNLAKSLGQSTRFNATETGRALLVLAKGGVEAKDILAGTGEAAVKLAQAGDVLPEVSAEAMVKIGNAYNIQGRAMLGLADIISRVDNASTASIASLTDGFKYASATAAQLGQNYRDTAVALAVLNNAGLDGTTAGTNYADMLRRLAPVTRMSAAAMRELGLTTADVESIKRGQSRIGLAGKDLFHDESGKLKPLAEIIRILREQTRGMRADVVQTAFTEIFGVEGARAALALMKQGKGSYEEINAAVERSMGLNERIREQQETFNARLEQFSEAWHNILVTGGTPLLDDLTRYVTAMGDALTRMQQFVGTHPRLVRAVLMGLAAFAGLNVAIGGARLLLGLTLGNFLSLGRGVLSVGRGILGITRSTVGFINTFRYFRQGAGFFRALWGAISFGHPTLIQAGALVARFGASLGHLAVQALAAAGRIAASWLIALGPVGWIIAGVTALVAGAVAAWKTNFLGFRDRVNAAWTWIKDRAAAVWNWLRENWRTLVGAMVNPVGFLVRYVIVHWGQIKARLAAIWESIKTTAAAAWQGVVDRIGGALDALRRLRAQALEWGKNLIVGFIDGIKAKIRAIPDALKGAAQRIKDFLGFHSPTREGPGREADRWAPNLVNMYAAGLLAGRARLAGAAAVLAKAAVIAPLASAQASLGTGRAPALAGAGAGAGGINITIHVGPVRIDSAGRPGYDAREFVERIGPEIIRYLGRKERTQRTRDPRLARQGPSWL
ncbi:MAG: phage tail tape measure protein [Bacillota bacterium]|nr:phage tail tape measure protein [Bacillota bacterium]